MTDLEKTRNLFKEMGANLKESESEGRIELSTYGAEPIEGVELMLGYSGFDCVIYFNKDGKFLGMGGFE